MNTDMYVLNLIKKFKLSKELFMLFYLLTVTYFFCDHFKFLKTSQKVYFSLIILRKFGNEVLIESLS